MTKVADRTFTFAALLLVVTHWNTAAGSAEMPQPTRVPQPTRASHATRDDLVGAWQLVRIRIVSSDGSRNDPFYNADSTGILLYQASGWMSVQIVGQPRPLMDAEASRPSRAETDDRAQLKAAVLDTYYAYFGTWEYDEATSTVTHHIKSSLIPGESGMSYSQTVTLKGNDLIFTSKREGTGAATVQEKIWTRIAGRQH